MVQEAHLVIRCIGVILNGNDSGISNNLGVLQYQAAEYTSVLVERAYLPHGSPQRTPRVVHCLDDIVGKNSRNVENDSI